MRTDLIRVSACLLFISCAQGAPDVADARAARTGTAAEFSGEGGDDSEPGVRERAARGLKISPVPVSTAGLSHRKLQQVGLGSYIVNGAADCNGCHGSQAGFLAGGNPFFLDRSGHVVWSRNLTPDPATGLALTEAQFVEALRTGRDFHAGQTRMLVVMPWLFLRWMSEEDLKAVYAYLRAVPAVQNAVPPDNKSDLPLPPSVPFPKRYTDGEVDRALPADGESFSARRGLAIAPRAHPAIGEDDDDGLRSYGVGSYIANATIGCTECHTNPSRTPDQRKINTPAYLSGGAVFAVPPPVQPLLRQVRSMSANLVGANYGFFNEPADSYARFRQVILTQSHADETPPRPLGFPMNLVAGNLSHLLEPDLQAIYSYVKGVPKVTGANDQPRQDYARFCTSAADCHAGESCAAATHECVGRACTADADCDTCQTCSAGTCAAPAPASACVGP